MSALRDAIKLIEELESHLEYTGWGDSWERECAEKLMDGLADRIKTLKAAQKGERKIATALRWAVGQAASWRGYHTGNPNELRAFDKQLEAARKALSDITPPRKYDGEAPRGVLEFKDVEATR